IGGPNACLQTAGAGSGGSFIKTGAGTLRILSSNGQNDDPFLLQAGSLDLRNANALGGSDNIALNISPGATLILDLDSSTNFFSPIRPTGAGQFNVIIQRQTAGPGVTHTLNLPNAGAQPITTPSATGWFMHVEPGSNITSGTAALILPGGATLQ